MSLCRLISCVVWKGCLLWPVRSLSKTLLAFVMLHSIFQGHIPLPITPGVSWLPSFAFQSPVMKRTSFLGIRSKRSCRSWRLQRQLLQRYWLGHRLGLLWYWMVCLVDKQGSSCLFWDCIQVLHFRLFCWPWWLLHFFWEIPARSGRYNGHLS